MKENQKQVQEGGNATLSVKVSQKTYDLLNILAEGLHHGTNANDLLKMFVHAFIESAKHTGPVSPEMQTLLNMLKIDEGWNRAFNFADPNAQTEVAQVVLILQQPGRKGFGLTMIDRPFMGDSRQTYCVDDILERIAEVSMKGLYKELRQVGVEYETESLRETLTLMADALIIKHLDEANMSEGPQLGNFSDFGRAIEYGKRTKRKKHFTPDTMPVTGNLFDDIDHNAPLDKPLEDWEGEHHDTR